MPWRRLSDGGYGSRIHKRNRKHRNFRRVINWYLLSWRCSKHNAQRDRSNTVLKRLDLIIVMEQRGLCQYVH